MKGSKSSIVGGVAMVCALAARSAALGAGSVGQAITLSGDRLVSDQTVLGDWPAQSLYTGAIIAGQGGAFLATGNSAYRTSTLNGANSILATADGQFLGDETWGLAVASQISIDPNSNAYRTALNTFFSTTVANYPGGTAGFANALVNAYTTEFHEQSEALYYLSEYTAAAVYVNAPAPTLSALRSALISTLAQVDDNDYYPISATGTALWALAKSGPLDGTIISASGFWSGKTLAALPGILAARQIPSGIDAHGFYAYFETNSGGYTEDAVYPMLGLAATNATGGYFTNVLDAKSWLATGTPASGANQGLIADNPNLPEHTNEMYTGESLQALTTRFGVIWNGGDGQWSENAQWSCSYAPTNGYPIGAYYDVTINGGNVTLDDNRTVCLLTMNGGTLTGAGNLTVAGGTIAGVLNVTGTTTITAATLIIGGTSQSMGGVAGGGCLFVSAGTTLTSDGVNMPTSILVVNGTQTIRSNAGNAAYPSNAAVPGENPATARPGTSKVASLVSTSGASGTLDIKNNGLIIQTTDTTSKATLLAQLAQQIQTNGTFTTIPNITSSTATNNPNFTVVLVDNADLNKTGGSTVFGGLPVDNNSIIVTQAAKGDANLDGFIDSIDFNVWLHGATPWSVAGGDLNMDGFVDSKDFNLWLHAGSPGITPSMAGGGDLTGGGASAVPEPASLAVLAVGGAVLLTRRRRRAVHSLDMIPQPADGIHPDKDEVR